MKLASTTGDFRGYAKTTADAVRFYEGTGFRHLDYNFYNVIYPESPFLGDRWLDEVEEAGREAERLGFDFIQAHSPNYNPFDPKADHEAGMLATIRSIEACGRLGIPNIVVHPGMTTELTYPDGRDGYFSRNRDFYRSLFPAMEKWNVNVLIENSAEANMGTRYFFMTGQEMRDFADYVDHPLLHCNWDIGHANMRGTDQREDILAMGGHLRGLHIQDNFGACDEHIAPFMGTTDMDAVMQGLIAAVPIPKCNDIRAVQPGGIIDIEQRRVIDQPQFQRTRSMMQPFGCLTKSVWRHAGVPRFRTEEIIDDTARHVRILGGDAQDLRQIIAAVVVAL